MLSGSRISHRHHRNLGFGFELGFGCFCYAKKFQLQISSSLNLKPKSTAINAPVEQGKRFSTSIQLKPSRSHAILLSHCFSQEKEHHKPPSEGLSPVQGGIVALGKFDALHIGHRELAIQAAKVGAPFLLSFVGMAEVLGWEPRPPIVAKCDRKRILSSWAPYCGNMTPMEFEVEFSKVRYLTPRQFVEKLSKELGVRGVVAGENYRFGYRASGNTFDLKNLCEDYNLESYIITSVMDKNRTSSDIIDSEDHGQVSSTRVRKALAKGNMNYVADLLGRRHRVMLMLEEEERKKSMVINSNRIISISRGCLLNLPPCEGRYENCSIVIGDGDEIVVPCRVLIDGRHVHMEFDEEVVEGHISISSQRIHLLGIEFGRS